MNTQVNKSHYCTPGYDNEERFISYYVQKREILDLIKDNSNVSVLEIGKGGGFLSTYLKSLGVNIKTFDFDQDLNPDYLGDVRNIADIVKDKFDIVVAFEILEHIPFQDIDEVLSQLSSITRRHVIISVPYVALYSNFRFKLPLLRPLYFILRLPLPIRHKFKGEHYWELGKRGFSPKKLRQKLSKLFYVKKEFVHPLSMFHRFFILEKIY